MSNVDSITLFDNHLDRFIIQYHITYLSIALVVMLENCMKLEQIISLTSSLITSDAPIPLFCYQSDTEYILAENGQYWSDTNTLPDRHYDMLTRNSCLLNRLACQLHKIAEFTGFVAIYHEYNNRLWLQWILFSGLLSFPLYFQWYNYWASAHLCYILKRSRYSNRAVNNSNRAVTVLGEV